jgi:hypothetical protein
MKKSQTFIVLSSLAVVAAAWECWTILNNKNGDTFSATIRKLGESQPFVVFAAGLVSGHLFWPLYDKEDE